MRKLQILFAASLAVFAFGALMAASASAVTFLLAEWLVNGAAITANLPVLAEGELLLEDTKVNVLFGAKAMALCSGSLTGTVGVSGADKVEMLWNLGETTLIAEKALEATGLTCTGQENCEKPVAWAVHLPWNSLLELMEDTTSFFAILLSSSGAGNPGWYIECEALGIKAEDECTAAEGVAEAKNVAGGVETVFSEAFTELAGLKLATCTGSGGAETGIVEGTGVENTTEAGTTLSVSSTG